MEDAVNVHYLAGCDRIENRLGMNVTFPPIHERQKVENLGAGILVSSVWPGVGSFCACNTSSKNLSCIQQSRGAFQRLMQAGSFRSVAFLKIMACNICIRRSTMPSM